MADTIQQFSVPRNTDSVITCVVSTAVPNDTLVGCVITWALYEQAFGIIQNDTAILVKTSDGDGGIVIPPSPPTAMEFDISLARSDLADLEYKNYYFEATVVDEIGDQVAVVSGVVAITVGANP